MPRVPRYQQQVETAPLNLPSAPMPQDSGLGSVSKAIGEVWEVSDAIARNATEEAENLQIAEAQAAYQREQNRVLYEPPMENNPDEQGFLHRQGKDAFSRAPAVQNAMRKWEMDNIPRIIKSERARARFNQWLAGARNGFDRTVERHAGAEFKRSQHAALDANIESLKETLGYVPLEEAERLIRDRVDGVPREDGSPDPTSLFARILQASLAKEQAIAIRGELVSRLHAKAIESRLADENADLDGVDAYIKNNRGSLGEAAISLEAKVSDLRVRQEQAAFVGDLVDNPDSPYRDRAPTDKDPKISEWNKVNYLQRIDDAAVLREVAKKYPKPAHRKAAVSLAMDRISAMESTRNEKIDTFEDRIYGDYAKAGRKLAGVSQSDLAWLKLNGGKRYDKFLRQVERDQQERSDRAYLLQNRKPRGTENLDAQYEGLAQLRLDVVREPKKFDGMIAEKIAAEYGLSGKFIDQGARVVADTQKALERDGGRALATFQRLLGGTVGSLPKQSRERFKSNVTLQFLEEMMHPDADPPSAKEVQGFLDRARTEPRYLEVDYWFDRKGVRGDFTPDELARTVPIEEPRQVSMQLAEENAPAPAVAADAQPADEFSEPVVVAPDNGGDGMEFVGPPVPDVAEASPLAEAPAQPADEPDGGMSLMPEMRQRFTQEDIARARKMAEIIAKRGNGVVTDEDVMAILERRAVKRSAP